jgi:phage tail-like protein
MAKQYHPTVNFSFRVHFPVSGNDVDVGFQSVSGLDSTIETENINEGGINHFTHAVPTKKKYGPLVCKRGILNENQSPLTKYIKGCFDNETIAPMQTVTIELLDEKNNPMLHWTASNVWPLSWKIGELNAMQGEVLIETLELNYNQLVFNDSTK